MRRSNSNQETDGGRETCFSCWRPSAHCVCNLVAPLEAHCNFLILQHPHERRKYYSTVRLLKAALTNIQILRGIEFPAGTIEGALQGRNPYLLFPADDAIDCADVRLSHDDVVIVLDGTWSEAGKILRRNRVLSAIPRISFQAPLRSEYQIRRQPKDHYLSTLECIAHLLTLNAERYQLFAGARPYDALMEGFRSMVHRQLNFFPRMRALTSPGGDVFG